MTSSMNILDGAEVDMNWKNLKHSQQRVQFSPIKILREFQKFKINYLQNVLMKFRENFATAAACHYLTTHSSNIIINYLTPPLAGGGGE